MKSPDGFNPGHLLGGADALSHSIGQPLTLGRRGGEFVALAIACLAMVIASLLMSAILTNFLILLHRPTPTLLNLDGHTLSVLLSMCLGTYENFLFCLLFGAALSILSRSAAFGIAAGFGYLIGEDIAAQILPVVGKSVHTPLGNQIVNLLFTPNLNAFYSNTLPPTLARTLDQLDGVIACTPVGHGCIPVNAGQSLLIVLIWALILGGVSTYLFIKRDVLQ